MYLAAPWVCKPEATAAAALLEAAGHTITKAWWEHREISIHDKSYEDELRGQAHEDLMGVIEARAIVVLNLKISEGKAVETGIALAMNKPMIFVGPRSNIFQTMGTEVDTIEAAIEVLKTAKYWL